MTHGHVEVPAEFWANFGDDFIQEAVNPQNPMERIRRYADRETYENWETGNFAVRFSDGRTESISGATFNAADIDAAKAKGQ